MQKQILLFSVGIGIPILQCFAIKELHVENKEWKQKYYDSLEKCEEYRRDLQTSQAKVELYKSFVEQKGLVNEFSKVEKKDEERRARKHLFFLHRS